MCVSACISYQKLKGLYVIVKSTFVSVFTIKRPKGASVLMVKILNKCILSTLVYNVFLDRQHNISIHRYIG